MGGGGTVTCTTTGRALLEPHLYRTQTDRQDPSPLLCSFSHSPGGAKTTFWFSNCCEKADLYSILLGKKQKKCELTYLSD